MLNSEAMCRNSVAGDLRHHAPGLTVADKPGKKTRIYLTRRCRLIRLRKGRVLACETRLMVKKNGEFLYRYCPASLISRGGIDTLCHRIYGVLK